MYAVTSSPLVKRTRATLRSAEFGFFGVTVLTWVQTPRRCGLPATSNVRDGRSGWPGFGPVRMTRNAGVLTFFSLFTRPLRTSWLIVGTQFPKKASEVARSRIHKQRRPEPPWLRPNLRSIPGRLCRVNAVSRGSDGGGRARPSGRARQRSLDG